MIVGPELRAFAGSRRRQRELGEAVNRLALDWRHGAVNRRFAETFQPLDRDDVDSVADAAWNLLAEDSWVDTLVGTLADELRRNPYFEPPFPVLNGELHTGLLIYEDDKVAIAAGVSRAVQIAGRKTAQRVRTSVNLTGQVNVLKFVKSGGATLSFWEAPRIGWDFSAETAGTCRRVESRSIADNEIVTIDGRSQAYVIDHVRSNILLLQAVVKAGQAPLGVEYDSESFAYVGCSAVDDHDSRIQMIATLVRKLDHQEAVPVLTAFLDHPSFFVRWHVMRELLGLDVRAALPHLRRMAAEDPHPDARHAAAAVIGRAEGALAERKAA